MTRCKRLSAAIWHLKPPEMFSRFLYFSDQIQYERNACEVDPEALLQAHGGGWKFWPAFQFRPSWS
jgi:hypothetical protein